MEVDFERAVAENDVERFVDIDEDFHDVIFQATENDKLIQMFRNLKIQLYRYRWHRRRAIIPCLPSWHTTEVFCVRWKIMTARKAQQWHRDISNTRQNPLCVLSKINKTI